MKKTTRIIILALLALGLADAQVEFNFESVTEKRNNITKSLKTNQIALAWEAAQDPAVKGDKFTLMLREIAGAILERQWIYPGETEWPLIDWSKVNSVSNLINDQKKIIETSHVVAQNDEELAKIGAVVEATIIMGSNASVWYEDWLLSLAKGSNTNLKRLVFLTTKSFGEDMEEETGSTRIVDWNKWEAAFNQADKLGKALLLVCMTDLAGRNENYTKLTAMHLSVFEGTNDDLKAIALYAGDRSLGPAVISKWQDIADNHSNVKLKALAQELLNRHSVESP